MKLSKRVKVLIGALTVWPFFWLLLSFPVFVLWWFLFGTSEGNGSESTANIAPLVVFSGFLVSIVIMFGLEIFYLLFLFRTSRVEPGKKALWAVVLLLGAGMAMPVFFFIYVWPDSWPKGTATISSVA